MTEVVGLPTLPNMSSINPGGRTVPLWLAVTVVLLALLVSQLFNHHQRVEDYRHMGDLLGQSELFQSKPPDKRPSMCDSWSRWLVGAPHSNARVSAFFEGCSGLDADD
jgi:hypothetical protein